MATNIQLNNFLEVKKMLKKIFTKIILLSIFIFPLLGFANEPPNLYFSTQAIIQYYNSGEYHKDVALVLNEAQNYLQQRIAANSEKKQKLAIVLDIDDTAIEEYDFWHKNDFSWQRAAAVEGTKIKFPPIKPTLDFYNYAKNNGVAIFFITGRYESDRRNTIQVLQNAGYEDWSCLYMRPDNDKRPTVEYKTSTRKCIEGAGYDIVLSIGDQKSDLKGGYADQTIKVPNPFYYIP